MAKIVAVHSFRGGTGKSNTTASLATAIAASGQKVAIIDADIQSPGIHVLFGLEPDKLNYRLNDYLWERCAIAEAAYDVSSDPVSQAGGKVFLVPSSVAVGDISRVLRDGYDVRLLKNAFNDLIQTLDLDFVFVDTHPGLNEETLLCVALTNTLVVILRPDYQDYQGTAVMLDLANRLRVPKILMIINRVLPNTDLEVLRQKLQTTYETPVVGLFPNCVEMMELGSSDVFYLRYPDHPLSQEIRTVAQQIIA